MFQSNKPRRVRYKDLALKSKDYTVSEILKDVHPDILAKSGKGAQSGYFDRDQSASSRADIELFNPILCSFVWRIVPLSLLKILTVLLSFSGPLLLSPILHYVTHKGR